MSKKILLFSLLIILLFACCGCGMPKIEETRNEKKSVFKLVQSCSGGDLIVDTETSVMYWLSTGAYNSGNLTLLVDSNGNPKLYSNRHEK